MEPVDIGLLIAIFGLLILSAMFSLCEIAYSAANKVRLKTLEQNGKKRAGRMLKFLDNYDKVITTILIGNTIVTVASASLATLLAVSLYYTHESIAASVASAILTITLLVFCEITPKMLAKEKPEGIGMAMYPFLWFFTIIFWPFTAIFAFWKKLIKKIFRIKGHAAITDEELLTYVEESEREGGIEKHESTLIRSAIEFEDVDVADVMVPRVEVIAVEKNDTLKEIDDKFKENAFSRMPVYDESIDNVIGILHERDFNLCLEKNSPILEVLQKNIWVPESMKISTVLRMFQKQKVHMAVVVDEHGGTSGVVTLEDILEELVGEIWDEHDEEELLTRRVNDDTFIVQGGENLEDLFETLGLGDGTEEFDSTTVGGFVTELAEKIPLKGEKFTYKNLEITVIKADVKRVLEVKVKLLAEKEEE